MKVVSVDILWVYSHWGAKNLEEAFANLMGQVGENPVSLATIIEAISDPRNNVLAAVAESGSIIGTLTLVKISLPAGPIHYIHNLVVDHQMRGNGVARSLVAEAIRIAHAQGGRHVNLTSRPSRLAANLLYQSMGFESRETNIYRYNLRPTSVTTEGR